MSLTFWTALLFVTYGIASVISFLGLLGVLDEGQRRNVKWVLPLVGFVVGAYIGRWLALVTR